MPNRYCLKRRVQFYETDAAGIVHFSWFYRYMEEAEHALWRAAGLSIAPHDADVGFPRVSASFDFRRPLYFEDEFEVTIVVDEIGEKTIQYSATVTRGTTQIATGSLTVACVRRVPGEQMRATPIPRDITDRLRTSDEDA